MGEPLDAQRRPAAEARHTAPPTDWTGLVERIRKGDPAGMEELYRKFARGVRFYLCRQLGPQELDDRVHDTFLIVLQAIQRSELREPERLMGFIRTIVKRQIAAHIDTAVQNRHDFQDLEPGGSLPDERASPEDTVISLQRVEIMETVLRGLSRRDREILTRFYLMEQTQEEICSEMDLSDTQFRLLKSRAKARFGELGRKTLTRRPLHKLFLRKSAGSSH
jgi:RNA polymerase sigma-70 factor (ECF subfamily)